MSDEVKKPQSEYQLIGSAEDGKISDLLVGKTAKESQQRLQALIAEWLRMDICDSSLRLGPDDERTVSSEFWLKL